jgi:acyl-CoA-binding protein
MSYGWVLSLTFSVDRPGLFDLKGKAKWDSWKSYSGKINNSIDIIVVLDYFT